MRDIGSGLEESAPSVCGQMPFSDELAALCQAQIQVLGQFHASVKGAVYFSHAADLQEAPRLFPVAVYPQFQPAKVLPADLSIALEHHRSSSPESSHPQLHPPGGLPISLEVNHGIFPYEDLGGAPNHDLNSPEEMLYQVVLPLQRERFVLGVLVVSRGDRDWLDSEYLRLEQIAQTVTLAGLMDQRMQWLQQQIQQRDRQLLSLQQVLDDLVHQIRNPITALKTFGKLLLRRLQLQDQNRTVATSIVRESDRLNFLVQQLQDQFARGVAPLPGFEEEDALRIQPQSLPQSPIGLLPDPQTTTPEDLAAARSSLFLEDILQPIIAAAQAIAEDRNLALSYHPPQNAAPILGHPLSLGESLSNLIDNALKYTPAPGAVKVQWCGHLSQHPGWQWVVISDTGPGIPAEDLPLLFQRHYRGVQALGDIPGTGLGLSLARDWLEAMGGHLEVISPAGDWRPTDGAGGPGVAFRLWLPESISPPEWCPSAPEESNRHGG